MLLRLVFSLALSQHLFCAAIRSRCYDEMREEFRCFDLWPPYTNTNFHLPASPSDQNIQFQLFTVHNRLTPDLVDPLDATSLHSSHFDASHPTKVIVHGFTSSSQQDWVHDMVHQLLLHHPLNVITVDWSAGAKGPNYFQAAANCRVVGAQIASLVLTAEQLGSSASSFHVIGHSLGAQIGGYAGAYLHGRLGRVSGLDPAAPQFENYGDAVKLEKTDAMFVDVIHTDAEPLHEAGLGTVDQIGHIDFFPLNQV
ncbi:pancreatic lipase-related protein 2-like [Babylonia areolata]|uniref:pancreatic lipase-related protein 2-like n=1 Tax=Babylonia areolata TaxID=304850 RepID=UPI003FD45486